MNINIERVNCMWVRYLLEWLGSFYLGWIGNVLGIV